MRIHEPSRPAGLSKSRVMAGLQCHKLLWWMMHEPTAPELELGDQAQSLMDRGNRVGEIARTYVPGIHFCCTSGHCEGCRDSQAVQTWLLVSVRHFLESRQGLQTWVELAENYWRQFVWSPYRASAGTRRSNSFPAHG